MLLMPQPVTTAAPRLRIVHVVSELAHGGTERVLFDLLSRLDASRFESRVLTTAGASAPEVCARFETAGIAVSELDCGLAAHATRGFAPAHASAKLRALRLLVQWMRDARPDLVHTHGPVNNTYGLAAARIARVRRIFVHDHNPVSQHLRSRVVTRVATRAADAALAASHTCGEARRDIAGPACARVLDLPNSIDLQRFRPPSETERRDARTRAGLPVEAFVAGAIGRFVPFKRLDLLVDAWWRVLAERPDAHLLLVGEGPEGESLRARAGAAGMLDRVHLRGWEDDPRRAHWALDVFAMPSDAHEGFGLAAVEAMACGRPVVASQTAIFEETLGSEAALLVAPTASAFAAAILSLAGDSGARARRASAARRHAVARYDIALTVRRLEALYVRACSDVASIRLGMVSDA